MSRAHLLVAIRSDLARVARESGRPEGVAPSVVVYREKGRFPTSQIRAAVGGRTKRWGTSCPALKWTEAVTRLGFRPASSLHKPTRAQAIEDVRRVGREVGCGPRELPTTMDYQEHGRWAPQTIRKAIVGREDASWYEIGDQIGLEPSRTRRGDVSKEGVLEDYRRVARELGLEPGGPGLTKRGFDEHIPYRAQAAVYHWGSWTALTEAAGFEAREPLFSEASIE